MISILVQYSFLFSHSFFLKVRVLQGTGLFNICQCVWTCTPVMAVFLFVGRISKAHRPQKSQELWIFPLTFLNGLTTIYGEKCELGKEKPADYFETIRHWLWVWKMLLYGTKSNSSIHLWQREASWWQEWNGIFTQHN